MRQKKHQNRATKGNQDAPNAEDNKGIAVIGMACRFPGARDYEEFWRNLEDGVNSISEIPKERWDWREYCGDLQTDVGKTHSKWGGFIEDIDKFDAAFFKISPREAEQMDPQQRILLELTWACIEDSGYCPSVLAGRKVGVFIGVCHNDYKEIQEKCGRSLEGFAASGTGVAILPNRISYVFDFRGPSINVDTACSSSLLSLHQAVRSIKCNECELAIAGGINYLGTATRHLALSNLGMLSPTGRCKTFDESADGYVRAEGAGLILLKPLKLAIDDNNRIYGVIKGSAANHGGRVRSLTSPNVFSQSKVILEACRIADISSDTITLIEAHGTGTPLGDPIEINGLIRAFKKLSSQFEIEKSNSPYCGISTVKTNIGHLEGAAGIAGFIKVLLAMKYKTLPALQNFCTLNPRISLNNSPFYILNAAKPWNRLTEVDGKPIPRRAGVSSFGFGGANAHVIVEEYEKPNKSEYKPNKSHETYIVVLSAKNEGRLKEVVKNLYTFLASSLVPRPLPLHDVAYTLQIGRQAMEERLAFLVNDGEALVNKLKHMMDTELNLDDVHHGNVRIINSGSNLLIKGRAVELLIETSIREKEYDTLAQLWTLGREIDWDLLYEDKKPRRVNLPTYPFAKKRYWIKGKVEDRGQLFERVDDRTFEKKISLFPGKTSEVGPKSTLSKPTGVSLLDPSSTFSLGFNQETREIKKPFTPVLKQVDPLTDLKSAMPEDTTGMIPTLNRTGVVIETLTHCSKSFAEYAGQCEGEVLDIGCAYGVATVAALEQGARVLAVDMEQQHLDILKDRIRDEARPLLSLQRGVLPDINFEEERFAAIHASRVIHFLKPDDVQKTIQKMYQWLQPGGKLFLVADSPYLGYWKSKSSEYEARKAAGDSWPGYIDNVGNYFDVRDVDGAPSLINPLDPDILRRECEAVGFDVEEVGFVGSGIDSEIEESKAGMEHVEIIAIKPVYQGCSMNDKIVVRNKHVIQKLREEPLPPVSETQGAEAYETVEEIRKTLQKTLAHELDIAVEAIDEETPFVDMGLNSISGVTWVRKINRQYGLSLTATRVYDYPNIRELAKLLEKELFKHKPPKSIPSTSSCAYRISSRRGSAITSSKRSRAIKQSPIDLSGLGDHYGLVLSTTHVFKELTLSKCIVPAPNPDEVTIQVRASGVNFTDTICVQGLYPAQYPFVPGFEVSGVISKVGDQILEFQVGDEVIALTGKHMGGHATYVNVSGKNVVHKPKHISFEDACSLPFGFGTVYHAFKLGKLSSKEHVLIQTASGGCGLLAIQLARLKGCICYGTSSRQKKLDHLTDLEIPYVLNYKTSEFDQEIKRITNNRGVDIVLNTLGGDAIQKGLNCLAHSGRYLELSTHGLLTSPKIDLSNMRFNQSLQVVCFHELISQPDSTFGRQVLDVMVSWLESGMIVPIVSRIYPIQQIDKALEYVSKGAHIGKVVISHTYEDMVDYTDSCKARLSEQKRNAERYASSITPFPTIDSREPTELITESVAIIGISGKFPASDDLTSFWDNLASGKNCISEIPATRWSIDDYYDPDPSVPGKTCCKWMGSLEGIDQFDPMFFGISPREATLMDPQQRLFLQSAWQCIEDSGSNPRSLSGSCCGVFVGCGPSDYQQLIDKNNGDTQGVIGATGGASSILPARISYLLNLKGPCLAIDTSCSSSLVAVVEACNHLLLETSDLALAGGVLVMPGPSLHIGLSQGRMLSKDGRCFTFDQRANGFVPGEGVGVILLKRLSDALRDEDHIYAEIKGWGINQDGKTNGITAPSVNSQISLEKQVYERFNINPETISLVEAHGTGTKLGDPIEVEALAESFRSYTDKKNYCALGSVKSNIGHLGVAAGIAGVLKSVLALQHRMLPPTINFETQNAHLSLKDSPFYINTQLRPWEAENGVPRRTSVSSFGFSGTNAYIVIEEYTERKLEIASCLRPSRKLGSLLHQREKPVSPAYKAGSARNSKFETSRGSISKNLKSQISNLKSSLIVLSAKNEDRLKEVVKNLHTYLTGNRESCSAGLPSLALREPETVNLHKIAYTLQVGREAMDERLAFVVKSEKDLLNTLRTLIESEMSCENAYRGNIRANKGKSGLGASKPEIEKFIATKDQRKELTELGRMWVLGMVVDWDQLYGDVKPKRISLPTYPFKKKRYWFASNSAGMAKGSLKQKSILTQSDRKMDVSPNEQLTETKYDGAEIHLDIINQTIAFVKIQSRENKNMFSPGVIRGLLAKFALIKKDPMIKAVIVTGYDRIFLAGGTQEGLISIVEEQTRCTDIPFLYQGLLECEVPVIAAMQGLAVGAGLTFGLYADIVIMAEEGTYSANFMKYGFTPGLGTTFILEQKLGKNIANEMMFTAKSFSGEELKNRGAPVIIIKQSEVVKEALSIANTLSEKPVDSLKVLKKSLASRVLEALPRVIEQELRMHEQTFYNNPEVMERINNHFKENKDDVNETDNSERRTAPHINQERIKINLRSIEDSDSKPSRRSQLSEAEVSTQKNITLDGAVCSQVTPVSKNSDPGSEASQIVAPKGGYDNLESIQDRVIKILGRILHLDEEIDVGTTFSELGIDSITAVEIIRDVNKAFSLNLESAIVYDYPTIAELSEYILKDYEKFDQIARSLKPLSDKSNRGPTEDRVSLDNNMLAKKEFHQPTRPDTSLPSTYQQQSLSRWGKDNGRLDKRTSEQKEKDKPAAKELASIQRDPILSDQSAAIAVIGISGRFPKANNVDEFWSNLAQGLDCITEIPASRWDINQYYDADPEAPNKTYSRWGGFLDDIDSFDASFFNISPKEAELMDPQQRLFLEEAWKCLGDAGYCKESLSGCECGVFVGAGPGDYTSLSSEFDGQYLTGNSGAILATRIAYFLNLTGPCIAVDTACSSSLTALHLACQGLVNGECEMALAGGVYIMTTPKMHIITSKLGILSPTGKCKPFDAGANGWVIGEGVGVAVLKRLAEAISDGDHIYGIIKGTGLNQNGTGNGLVAPKALTQAKLQRRVYQKACVTPETIDYLEIQGTGTLTGDAVEVRALKESFSSTSHKKGYCDLGSLKPNIGHPLTASGISVLIKILLSLKYGKIPPTINLERFNPDLKLDNTPFYINKQLKDWKRRHGQPRRAAINGFGLSGTNCHVILEEYIPCTSVGIPTSNVPTLFVFSAKTRGRLKAYATAMLNFFRTLMVGKSCPNSSDYTLENIAYTLVVGRDVMDERLAIIADSLERLVNGLEIYTLSSENAGHSPTVYWGRSVDSDESKPRRQAGPSEIGEVTQAVRDRKLNQLAALWVAGRSVPFGELYKNSQVQKISVPCVPFARRRFWINTATHPDAFASSSLTGKSKTIQEPTVVTSGHVRSNQGKSFLDTGDITQGEVVQILATLLRIDSDQIKSNTRFSECGVDSIIAIQLNNRLFKSFGVRLTPDELAIHNTVDKLHRLLISKVSVRKDPLNTAESEPTDSESASKTDARPSKTQKNETLELQRTVPVVAANDSFPLSFEQERHWMIEKLRPDGSSLTIPVAFRLFGKLQMDLVKACVDTIVKRHESLRTVFRETEDEGRRQVVLPTIEVDVVENDFKDASTEAQRALIERLIKTMQETKFNLETGPLFRINIAHLGADNHVFLLVIHHIISDAWSVAIFLKELSVLYQALVEKQPYSLPSLPKHYRDYVIWERNFFNKRLLEKRSVYWEDVWSGGGMRLNLPYRQQNRSSQPVSKSSAFFMRLSQSEVQKIEHGCAAHSETPFIVFLSALSVCLYGLTEETRIPVGVPVLNREFMEAESIIGFFAYLSVVIPELHDTLTVAELRSQIKQKIDQSREHLIPFSEMVRIVQAESQGHTAFLPIRVAFSFISQNTMTIEFPEVECEPIEVNRPYLDFDLFLGVVKDKAGYRLCLEYITDHFDIQTIKRLAKQFLSIAERIASTPDHRVGDILKEIHVMKHRPLVVASTFTAEGIKEILEFWAEKFQTPIKIDFAGYNQIFQELLSNDGLFTENTNGTNIILIRFEDWISDFAKKKGFVQDWLVAQEELKQNVLEFIGILQSTLHRGHIPIVVCIGPDSPDLERHHGWREMTAEMTTLMKERFIEDSQVDIIEDRDIRSVYPVVEYYDSHRNELAHIPYTGEYFSALGTMIFRKIFAQSQAVLYKVIVVDCDNTLWEGAVGEDGVQGIKIGAGRKAFQRLLVKQHQAGILICVCSKNNEADVMDVFEQRQDMIVKISQITSTRINWKPKSENLIDLANELNLGLDSFIFIDDSPVECAEVRANCSEVLTLQLPNSEELIERFVKAVWIFDRRSVTEEDSKRTMYYQQNIEREKFRQSTPTYESFLQGLKLDVSIRPPLESELSRISQLSYRTNQFNTTTIRRSEDELEQLLSNGKYECLAVQVKDRFGDYGLAGVLIYETQKDQLRVDSFMLSCRVFGRGVEHKMLSKLSQIAIDKQITNVVLPIITNKKNKPALTFLQNISKEIQAPSFDNGQFVFPADKLIGLTFTAKSPGRSSRETDNRDTREYGTNIPFDTRLLEELMHSLWQKYQDVSVVESEVSGRKSKPVQDQKGNLGDCRKEEVSLSQIFQKVSNISIDIDADFFESGISSFDMVQIVTEIKNDLGTEIFFPDLVTHNTIKKLARHIHCLNNKLQNELDTDELESERCATAQNNLDRKGQNGVDQKPLGEIELFLKEFIQNGNILWAKGDAIRCAINPNNNVHDLTKLAKEKKEQILSYRGDVNVYAPLSSTQSLMYVQSELYKNTAYNEPLAFQINGKLDIAVLEKSLNEVVRRHETLRTVFLKIAGIPVQAVLNHHPIVVNFHDIRDQDIDNELLMNLLENERLRPFDISHGPLLRVVLFQLSDESYFLVNIFHQANFDGSSAYIFTNELLHFYTSYCAKVSPAPPPLTAQYTDYVLSRLQVSSETVVKEKNYWSSVLERSVLFPTEFARKENGKLAGGGNTHTIQVADMLYKRLKTFSRENQVSVNFVLLTTVSLLLSKWADLQEIVIGVAVNQRNHASHQNLVGNFYEMMPLPISVRSTNTELEFAKQIQQTFFNNINHLQSTALSEMVKKQHMLKPSYNVLWDMLNFNLISTTTAGEARWIPWENFQLSTSIVDLAFYGVESRRALSIIITYKSNLYSTQTVRSLADAFIAILEKQLSTPELSVQYLPTSISFGLTDVSKDDQANNKSNPGATSSRTSKPPLKQTLKKRSRPLQQDLNHEVNLDPMIYATSNELSQRTLASPVLLTGSTGFLGAFLLEELLQQQSGKIYCLGRGKNENDVWQRIVSNLTKFIDYRSEWDKRIIPVPGDLGKPLLGLTENDFDKLADEVEIIYHNGALVNFLYPFEALKDVNVRGTHEVLRLGTRSHCKLIYYVSTIGIFDRLYYAKQPVSEADVSYVFDGLPNGYFQTKWVAERLVNLARMRGVPVVTVRPGMVLGDSRSGATSVTDIGTSLILSYRELGLIGAEKLNMIGAPVDMIAKAIVNLEYENSGSVNTYHLFHPSPVDLNEIVAASFKDLGYSFNRCAIQQIYQKITEEATPSNHLRSVKLLLQNLDFDNLGNVPRFKSDMTYDKLKAKSICFPKIEHHLFSKMLLKINGKS